MTVDNNKLDISSPSGFQMHHLISMRNMASAEVLPSCGSELKCCHLVAVIWWLWAEVLHLMVVSWSAAIWWLWAELLPFGGCELKCCHLVAVSWSPAIWWLLAEMLLSGALSWCCHLMGVSWNAAIWGCKLKCCNLVVSLSQHKTAI